MKREPFDRSMDDAQLDRALEFLHNGTRSVYVEDSTSLYPRHLAAMPVRSPNLREFTVSRCNYRDEFVPRSSGAIFRLLVSIMTHKSNQRRNIEQILEKDLQPTGLSLKIFRTYVPHYWPTESGAALEHLTTLTINDDPALSYARHLDIAADLPRLAPNLRVFHWHYGKQYNQERMAQQDLTRDSC